MSTRSDKMKARMTDPAFRAKAMENLKRGQAALAAKRGKKTEPPVADPKAKPASTPAAAPSASRAFGVGRWRGI